MSVGDQSAAQCEFVARHEHARSRTKGGVERVGRDGSAADCEFVPLGQVICTWTRHRSHNREERVAAECQLVPRGEAVWSWPHCGNHGGGKRMCVFCKARG